MLSSLTKICIRCQQAKNPATEFNRTRRGTPESQCKTCRNELKRARYAQNPGPVKAAKQRYRQSGKEAEHKRNRWKTDQAYRTRQKAHSLKHYRTEAGKAKRREASRRSRENPHNKIKANLQGRIRDALKGQIKHEGTMALLGCSCEQLIKHIEGQWLPGMSWANYGAYRVGTPMTWHIDHIIPCAAFDLTNPEEQRKCFHWSNLQPLWARDNMIKRDWVPDYQI